MGKELWGFSHEYRLAITHKGVLGLPLKYLFVTSALHPLPPSLLLGHCKAPQPPCQAYFPLLASNLFSTHAKHFFFF